jgi:hypothetical protein
MCATIRAVFATAAALLLASCAHGVTNVSTARGEPVGVNSVDRATPVTGGTGGGGLDPAPTVMSTTHAGEAASSR